jgi:uncharacterized protein (DUF1501 family)
MDEIIEQARLISRRQLLTRTSLGLGAVALSSLINPALLAAAESATTKPAGPFKAPHFAPRAKRVIYLFQSGGPSHLELFDYKPKLEALYGQDLPPSVRMGQRLTGFTSGQAKLPVIPSKFPFKQAGKNGVWLSELMPHTSRIVDELCLVRSMHTEAINHDPAITLMQTGSQLPGRPSVGSWVDYGLGSENSDLPAFVVLISKGKAKAAAQGLLARLWGSGFLPTQHQGVKLRSKGDPILYLSNPDGIDAAARRDMLDGIAKLNAMRHASLGDPEIETRIAQYEMAYRMQSSVPELMDLAGEPQSTYDLYGSDARTPGTYAANALLARRLVERGVRFVQLYHRDWDQHDNLPGQLTVNCRETDQPSAALITDLKQRGLLDETLVVWGGEFGRTVFAQGGASKDNYGRDHHGRCFSIWMAGGGIKSGIVHGETDEFGYNVVKDPVHVHDLNATILHCLGINHERLTFKFQGRHYRLTDVEGEVVEPLLA